MNEKTPVDAVLLISTACPHCVKMLQVMCQWIKDASIGQLEVINIASAPARAKEFGVRSVPWLRLGVFELGGAYTEGELRTWLQHAQSPQGMTYYFNSLLENGHLDKVSQLIKMKPEYLHYLVTMIASPDTSMKVQLGMAALFEEFSALDILSSIVGELGTLSQHNSPSVRADVAHYLALTGSKDAFPYLNQLIQDENLDVREIAAESLTILNK